MLLICFCHVAMEEMFAGVIGVPYHAAITKEHVGYPTVHVEADYRLPVGFGETIEMEVATERIGTKSVAFRYTGRISEDRVAFVVRSTAVAVDMREWKSIPIPDHHREGLASLLSGDPDEKAP